MHRHASEILNQADALLFGRVTYEMMEAAWRPPAPTGPRPAWMEPFARTIDAAKKYVVSSTLDVDRVDWNAELVRGDLGKAVQSISPFLGFLLRPEHRRSGLDGHRVRLQHQKTFLQRVTRTVAECTSIPGFHRAVVHPVPNNPLSVSLPDFVSHRNLGFSTPFLASVH